MAIMVYKRAVFETRKKPKGFLRPKTRANLKDAQTVSPLNTSADLVNPGINKLTYNLISNCIHMWDILVIRHQLIHA